MEIFIDEHVADCYVIQFRIGRSAKGMARFFWTLVAVGGDGASLQPELGSVRSVSMFTSTPWLQLPEYRDSSEYKLTISAATQSTCHSGLGALMSYFRTVCCSILTEAKSIDSSKRPLGSSSPKEPVWFNCQTLWVCTICCSRRNEVFVMQRREPLRCGTGRGRRLKRRSIQRDCGISESARMVSSAKTRNSRTWTFCRSLESSWC